MMAGWLLPPLGESDLISCVPPTMSKATSWVAKASILARVSEAKAIHESKTMCVR